LTDAEIGKISSFRSGTKYGLNTMGGNLMYEFIHYQVRDVMTPKPVKVRQDVTLADVEAIFEECNFNGLPVVDIDNKLIGMITKLDLLKAFAFTEKSMLPSYRTIMDQTLSQVMVKELDVVYPETSLTRVLQRMIETNYKSFPVVEDDQVTGIVAREDILRAIRRAAQGNMPARLL